jgi:hypothetical protein
VFGEGDMVIPGVPDGALEWLHLNYGTGSGALGLRHTPSGIATCRECVPGVPVSQLAEELAAKLRENLQNAGLITQEQNLRGEVT